MSKLINSQVQIRRRIVILVRFAGLQPLLDIANHRDDVVRWAGDEIHSTAPIETGRRKFSAKHIIARNLLHSIGRATELPRGKEWPQEAQKAQKGLDSFCAFCGYDL